MTEQIKIYGENLTKLITDMLHKLSLDHKDKPLQHTSAPYFQCPQRLTLVGPLQWMTFTSNKHQPEQWNRTENQKA